MHSKLNLVVIIIIVTLMTPRIKISVFLGRHIEVLGGPCPSHAQAPTPVAPPLVWLDGEKSVIKQSRQFGEKTTSADSSDLLSSNMVVQLSSWSIIIYFPNPGK